MKPKKRLSRREEFEILKLVLDKILLFGFAIIGYGLWALYSRGDASGFFVIIVGAVVLFIFTILLIKEYEIIR